MIRRLLIPSFVASCVALVAATGAQTTPPTVGTVTTVQNGKITVALSDGGTLAFSADDLAPNAAIVEGRQAKRLADITVGARLTITVGADFAIHRIEIGASGGAAPIATSKPVSPPHATPPATKPTTPVQWNTPSINGKVRWWTGEVSERGTNGSGDQMTMAFVLRKPNSPETMEFHPDARTKFYVITNGKSVPATFAAITLGKIVSAASEDGQLLQATVR